MRTAQQVFSGLLVVAALAAAGCESLPGGKTRAVEIALREYERHGGAGHVETQAFHTGGIWRVTIWTAPENVGGYVVIEITNSGKVVSYSAGN